ncbi:Tetratricopeptide-like helical domain [Trinorchestia longiramus]|nr:Tetratricopeptide-like helical domain [Trinorchestia longiramus]
MTKQCLSIEETSVFGAGDPNEVQRYLELGVQMLARGQLHDALAQFHAAIDGDPNNYLSYYRRFVLFLFLDLW